MRVKCDELTVSRAALNNYGHLEPMIRELRDRRPLDLNAQAWRPANPTGTFAQWQTEARHCLLEGLHLDPGPLDLQPEILDRVPRDGFILERMAFNTAPWSRVNGYFLLPTGVDYPVPGLVIFHAWGGPMLFGKERIVDSGRDHPVLAAHRAEYYGGRYCAEEFARRGYAVIVIDAHHFGERIPLGVAGVPDQIDPFTLGTEEFAQLNDRVAEQLYLGVRQLNWAGTTWMGVNYWDDRRCVDYLASRPEVDAERLGCTGLSGGGWRTNILGALDARIKAAVSGCWMTTGDYQQVYNADGAIGTFCLLPGVWDRLDVPDLTIMSAPCASMVVSTMDDPLFPPEGQREAERQIRLGYEWAGCTQKFSHNAPNKPHCFDVDLQMDALSWFDHHLKVAARN